MMRRMPSSPRAAVAAAFLIHSTVSGTWAPRLPAIKESLGMSDGELGTALVGLAIGLVAGTRVAGAPIDRFGSRPVMRAGFPLLAATLLLPGLAGTAPTLFLALLVLGFASGALDVAMNAQGIEVERRLGRPILSGLHGLWSVGLGVGAGAAAMAAAAGLDPLAHFTIVAAVLALASVVFLRGLLAAEHHVREEHERGGRPRPPRDRPTGGPRGNDRLRRLGGRSNHDRLAGRGHEPAHLTGPGGAAGGADRNLRARLSAPDVAPQAGEHGKY